MPFKVGDKVRKIRSGPLDWEANGRSEGIAMGTICTISEVNGNYICVKGSGIIISPLHFELVESIETNKTNMLKKGDRVKLISDHYGDYANNPVWGGSQGKIMGIYMGTGSVDWDNGRSNNYDDKYLEKLEKVEEVKINKKNMTFKQYKKIAKIGDKIILDYENKHAEGLVGDMGITYITFWSNEAKLNGGIKPPASSGYDYGWKIPDHATLQINLVEEKKFTKKRKAYVEITKESGKVFVNLKIPEEVEQLFIDTSAGETQQSNAWFDKNQKGIIFYKQPKELENKLCEIDEYVYSDFGSGLMKDNYINVSILRTVGVSKGIKLYSKGFSSLTNADLQNYVKKLGVYIKKLWESNISSTKIKSVITFEI